VIGRLPPLVSTILIASAAAPIACRSANVGAMSVPQFAGFGSARVGITPLSCQMPEFGNVASDALADRLMRAGVQVVERTYLSRLLSEQGIQVTGLTEGLDLSRIGEIANVAYLLVGTVSAQNQGYTSGFGAWTRRGTAPMVAGATARIIDVVTGQVVVTATYQVGSGWKWHQPVTVGDSIGAAIVEAMPKR
jgi:curli biogenesis system outer membrane secretion channel CsgG